MKKSWLFYLWSVPMVLLYAVLGMTPWLVAPLGAIIVFVVVLDFYFIPKAYNTVLDKCPKQTPYEAGLFIQSELERIKNIPYVAVKPIDTSTN